MLKSLFTVLIRFYQLLVSPLLVVVAGNHGCKYQPTCSEYTVGVIKEHGIIKGMRLGLKRLATCW